jgi:DNA mismatch repair protein MSH6
MSKKASKEDDGKQRTLLGFFAKVCCPTLGAHAFSRRDAHRGSQKDMTAPTPAPKAPTKPVQRPPTPPLTGKKQVEPITINSSPARVAPVNKVASMPTPPLTDDSKMLIDGPPEEEDEDEEEAAVSQPVRSLPYSARLSLMLFPIQRKSGNKRRVIVDSESDDDATAKKSAPVKRPRTSSIVKRGKRKADDDFIDDGKEEDSDSAPPSAPSPASSTAEKPRAKSKANGTAKSKAGSSLKVRSQSGSTRPRSRLHVQAPDLKRNPSSSSSTSFMKTNAQQQKEAVKQARREEQISFQFLHPDYIRDADKKRPDDPDYDPRTLFIPPNEWKTLTPFEQQFWDIKKNHMDTVLFFQKGKFVRLPSSR